MALTQIQTGMLADGILTADAAGRLKMADGFVNFSKIADAAVVNSKLQIWESWAVTSSNGTSCTWVRTAIGNNRFLWLLFMDSVNAGSYINMPNGSGSNGTSLGNWYVRDNILYAECSRFKRYTWHGAEGLRGFSGWNYVAIGNDMSINRFNHSLGGVDALFAAIMITVGQ